MFNLNELFIPTDYDLSTWTDTTNLIYKNKAYYQFHKEGYESGFYNEYYDIVEQSSSVKLNMNSNYSIMVDRIILYLLTIDETKLDVLLDGEIKDWTVKVTDDKMLITYRGNNDDKFKSTREKVYIINIKEYESELTKYKEFKYCIDRYRNMYNETLFVDYEKFVDTVEKRLLTEETDKREADELIKSFKDAYKDNQNSIPDDEWERMICVFESFELPMREIIEDELYSIPYTVVDEISTIDYAILNTKLKEICLKEQNHY